MKTFTFHLQEGKDILIQVPDGVEVKREEVFALAALEAQDQIANGNLQITKRIWPCFYCNTDYDEQGELVRHLSSHETREKRLKEQLAHLYKRPEDIPPAKIPYAETDGYKVRQIRTALGESQAQFAKRFNTTQIRVSMWETNRQKPPKEALQRE